MDSKNKYRQLSYAESTISLPSRDWWLDAVAGEENWNVVTAERNNKIVASLPYMLRKKLIFRVIQMPRFTPSMGVWIKYPEGQKYATKLSYEKKICDELIEQLPKFDRFHQRFHHSFTNWLPFFWNNFEQTTRYVYIIKDLADLDKLFANFRDNIRREIRKAAKIVSVYNDDDLDQYYQIIKKTFGRQNKALSYSLEYFGRIDEACAARNCRKIFFARDEKGQTHSTLYLVWDENSAYYLMGGSDPELRNSGAASLLMWEAIKFSSTVTKEFNFAGSMMEPIERFFRAFGGIQTPYFSIYKNNWLFKLVDAFREKK